MALKEEKISGFNFGWGPFKSFNAIVLILMDILIFNLWL